MTPKASTARPIRRAPEPREPYLPPGAARLRSALRVYRHQLRAGGLETLACALWSDLWDARPDRLDAIIRERLAMPSHARFLVAGFDPHDRVDPPGDRPAAEGWQPLWRPPVGAAADEGRAAP